MESEGRAPPRANARIRPQDGQGPQGPGGALPTKTHFPSLLYTNQLFITLNPKFTERHISHSTQFRGVLLRSARQKSRTERRDPPSRAFKETSPRSVNFRLPFLVKQLHMEIPKDYSVGALNSLTVSLLNRKWCTGRCTTSTITIN